MTMTIKRWFTFTTLSLACLLPQQSFAQTTAWQDAPFEVRQVPAISSMMRTGEAAPADGMLTSELQVIAAKGEYEPVSFVISPREDIDQLEIKATHLVGAAGTIYGSFVDIKVVKVWYQGGTAWYSYFGDSNRRQLVPELLLNDETLVKVDKVNRENYLRVGDEYQSVSYTKENPRKFFNYLTEPVADSPTLQPVSLKKGEHKQIWVTVHVPKAANDGSYTGKLNLSSNGKELGSIKLTLRVLPFELPMPKTYYNMNNDFMVTLYGTGIYELCQKMNIPLEEADRMTMLYYKDLLEHNVFNVRADLMLKDVPDRQAAMKALTHEIEMIKKAGFVTKPLFTHGWGYWADDEEADQNIKKYKARIDDLAKTIKAAAGHDDVYITSWDEANRTRVLVMRPLLEYAQKQGLKVWLTTAADRHFDLEGYVLDYANHGGFYNKDTVDMWHSIGSKVGSYAGPHSGHENPVVYRIFEGLVRYKAKYDGSYNYTYYSEIPANGMDTATSNTWNDFQGGSFRRFNFVYPTRNGPIDTIAWEGFREGIDDIRYATQLKMEAAEATESGNMEAVFEAKKALIWLELLDARHADLNTVRLEMIDHILKIRKVMGK